MILSALLALAGISTAGTPAAAQPLPPDRTVDDRFRGQTVRLPPETAAEEALLTGRDDLVLLRKIKLFTLHGSATAIGTSNAFLSDAGARKDVYGVAEGGLRIATRIAGKVDLFADAGVVAVRYSTHAELGYSALTGGVGAKTSVEGVSLSLGYQPSIIFTRDFGRRQLTQHRFAASVSLPLRVGRLTIEPSLAGERVLASPGDYRNWAGSAQLALSYPVSAKLPIALFASGGHEWRRYDNYFPDLVGVRRSDKSWRASGGVQWRVAPWADLVAQISWQRNRSTSDVNRYRTFNAPLALSLRTRF